MPTTVKVGLLKRNSNPVFSGTVLEAINVQFSEMQDAHLAYYAPAYNYDITTVQPAGGIYSLNAPNIPQGAYLGLDFSLGSGSNLRQTRYFASCNSANGSTGWNDVIASTAQNITLTPLSPFTLIG